MYPVDSGSFRSMSTLPPPPPDSQRIPGSSPDGIPGAGSPIVRLRLLSPTHRRIWDNYQVLPSGEWAWKKQAAMTTKALMESKPPWTLYQGPGETNERGYFIPSTDPGIDPPKPAAIGKYDGGGR